MSVLSLINLDVCLASDELGFGATCFIDSKFDIISVIPLRVPFEGIEGSNLSGSHLYSDALDNAFFIVTLEESGWASRFPFA